MVGGARRRRWIILKAAVSRLSATQSLCIQALGKTQVVTRMVNCAAVGNPCGPGAWLPGARSTAVSRFSAPARVRSRGRADRRFACPRSHPIRACASSGCSRFRPSGTRRSPDRAHRDRTTRIGIMPEDLVLGPPLVFERLVNGGGDLFVSFGYGPRGGHGDTLMHPYPLRIQLH